MALYIVMRVIHQQGIIMFWLFSFVETASGKLNSELRTIIVYERYFCCLTHWCNIFLLEKQFDFNLLYKGLCSKHCQFYWHMLKCTSSYGHAIFHRCWPVWRCEFPLSRTRLLWEPTNFNLHTWSRCFQSLWGHSRFRFSQSGHLVYKRTGYHR